MFLTGIGLDLIGLVGNTDEEATLVQQSASTLTGLPLLISIPPIIGLSVAVIVFKKKFKLTDAYSEEIHRQLRG